MVEKIPFFALTALFCAITWVVQRKEGAMLPMADQPFAWRAENAAVAYCRYLGKFFWPENLSVIYPVAGHWPMPVVALSILVLAGISVVAIALARRFGYLLTGWFWFAGTLVPVLGLVAVGEQSMADRYTYVPQIGVLILLGWGAGDLAGRRRYGPVAAACAAAGVIATCAILTRENIGYWKNTETLFRHAATVTSDNYAAHGILANLYLDQGRLDETIGEFRAVVRLKPNAGKTRNNLGAALGMKGLFAEAADEFQAASRLQPDDPEIRFNLGKVLAATGRLDEAIHAFQESIRLNPKTAWAHINLGILLNQKGRPDEAILQYQEALRLDPDNDTARRGLGEALGMKRR